MSAEEEERWAARYLGLERAMRRVARLAAYIRAKDFADYLLARDEAAGLSAGSGPRNGPDKAGYDCTGCRSIS
jgi:hypothetical protein